MMLLPIPDRPPPVRLIRRPLLHLVRLIRHPLIRVTLILTIHTHRIRINLVISSSFYNALLFM